MLAFAASGVEADGTFGIAILGNVDSEVAALIDKLGNSDWVKQGLQFLPDEIGGDSENCPFCQESTITSKFVSSIREYFDETYQKQIDNLETLKATYVAASAELQDINKGTRDVSVTQVSVSPGYFAEQCWKNRTKNQESKDTTSSGTFERFASRLQ
jgi:wobble nucleotide-excising tRNase